MTRWTVSERAVMATGESSCMGLVVAAQLAVQDSSVRLTGRNRRNVPVAPHKLHAIDASQVVEAIYKSSSSQRDVAIRRLRQSR